MMRLRARLTVLWLVAIAAPVVAAELPRAPGDADYYDGGRAPVEKIDLGRNLFFDKALSGNRNISCATCHHPATHTGDALSLSIGEGGRGQGIARNTGVFPNAVSERVSRNAQALFNLGAREFRRMFHDGRVEQSAGSGSGILSPAGAELPAGLDNVLAAQAMFPVASTTEMAGQYGENSIGTAAALGDFTSVWRALATRLRDPGNGYVELFRKAFPDIATPDGITFVHAANAIAAFTAQVWRADGSPFHRFLRGEKRALDAGQVRGMDLFFGKARCSSCHAGPFLTDHAFHSIGVPQIGPGKGNGFDGREDFGRARVTGAPRHRYRFRTPSLINVALTGPWGHNGAFGTLDAVVRRHLDAGRAPAKFDRAQLVLVSRPDLDVLDFIAFDDPLRRRAVADSVDVTPVALTEPEIQNLLAFLDGLTDPASVDLAADVPRTVPSGLPVSD